MLVTITQHFFEANRQWRIGENPDVSRETAARWIADGKATADTDGTQSDSLVSGGVSIIAQSGAPVVLTGSTAETILATINVPAGLIRENDAIRITALFSRTNNANNISYIIKFGQSQTEYYNNGNTSNAGMAVQIVIRARNSISSQIGLYRFGLQPFGNMAGLSTSTENMAVQQPITLRAILANAADTVTLEGYTVEALRFS